MGLWDGMEWERQYGTEQEQGMISLDIYYQHLGGIFVGKVDMQIYMNGRYLGKMNCDSADLPSVQRLMENANWHEGKV